MQTRTNHNHERQQEVESIFHAALDRPAPSERAVSYLDGACGDDPQLYSKVQSLLRAHDESGDFLIAETIERPTEGPG